MGDTAQALSLPTKTPDHLKSFHAIELNELHLHLRGELAKLDSGERIRSRNELTIVACEDERGGYARSVESSPFALEYEHRPDNKSVRPHSEAIDAETSCISSCTTANDNPVFLLRSIFNEATSLHTGQKFPLHLLENTVVEAGEWATVKFGETL